MKNKTLLVIFTSLLVFNGINAESWFSFSWVRNYVYNFFYKPAPRKPSLTENQKIAIQQIKELENSKLQKRWDYEVYGPDNSGSDILQYGAQKAIENKYSGYYKKITGNSLFLHNRMENNAFHDELNCLKKTLIFLKDEWQNKPTTEKTLEAEIYYNNTRARLYQEIDSFLDIKNREAFTRSYPYLDLDNKNKPARIAADLIKNRQQYDKEHNQ